MALTVHQKFHLDAHLVEIERNRMPGVRQDRLATIQGKSISEYLVYLNQMEVKTKSVLQSGVFPVELKFPSEIHDYLGKE